MAASTIIVQYKDGSPARGARVTLGFSGGQTDAEYTDSSGRATIEHTSVGKAIVYVNGDRCDSFCAPGKCAVTLGR